MAQPLVAAEPEPADANSFVSEDADDLMDDEGAPPVADSVEPQPEEARSYMASVEVPPAGLTDSVDEFEFEADLPMDEASDLDQPTQEIPSPETPLVPATELPPKRIARYEPSQLAAGRWAEAARALVREAALSADPQRAARLYAEAGRLQFSRLGDWDEARRLFDLALSAGADQAGALQDYADIVAEKGEYRLLRDLLERHSSTLSGPAAAERLEDAALVERNNLRDDAAAIALLQRALSIQPDDWFALRLLRELHFRNQQWAELVAVLTEMARLNSGPRAARLHFERGTVLEEHLQDLSGAEAAYTEARAVDPSNTASFLALERIARQRGDAAALSALYAAEAERDDGADAQFWMARSVRMARAAGLPDEQITERYQALAEAGSCLRDEQQAWLLAKGQTEALIDSLRASVSEQAGGEGAVAHYRLARALQSAGQLEEALEHYRKVVELDPAAGPAIEAVSRILTEQGDYAGLLAFLEAHMAHIDDPNLVVTHLYRMGELCEGPLADQVGARRHFEAILDTAPGYLPALEGLERVYTRIQAWEPLAAVYEQRALLTEDPKGIALQLHRAGSVCDLRLNDLKRARDFYRRALDHEPDFLPSLDAYARILELEGEWTALAHALAEAGRSARDSSEVVSLTYRAARLFAEKVGDTEAAMASLRRCLDLSPGFLPAIAMLRDLAARVGSWREVYDLHRLEADSAEDLDRRHWQMLAAADTAEQTEGLDPQAVVREILAEDENHDAALKRLELIALQQGDIPALIDVLRRRAASTEDEQLRADLVSRIIDLASEAGDAVTAMQALSELISSTAEQRPLSAAARIAEGLRYWEEAQRALEAVSGTALTPEIARLQEAYLDDAEAVARSWQALLAENPEDTEAATGVERTARRAGLREGLVEAHATLATHLPDQSIRAVHALLAGHLTEATGDLPKAISFYEQAFTARPCNGKAFDALLRLHTQARDGAALASLFERSPDATPLDLANALEEAGLYEEAIAQYRQALDAEPQGASALAVWTRLEQDLTEVGRWREVFEALGARLELTADRDERAAIESKRRWILAEKLAETDEAWDFYRQLHEEQPDDAEVLEALARIAGARGDTGLAVQYLDGLAGVAADPVDGARYHRRVAELLHGIGGRDDEARVAYQRALDLVPDDQQALAGLETLAAEAGDWSGLVGVLARQATVVDPEAQIAIYRRIAVVWEEQIGDASVAGDAWQKVLDLAPGDTEALTHLAGLARTAGDHKRFAQVASLLVEGLEGQERSALETELGFVYLQKLYQEEDALRCFDAASQGTSPSFDAAFQLERIHAAHGAWEQVIDAICRQAKASEGDAAIKLYLRAAQTRLETLHDRDGAAKVYDKVLELEPDNGEALRFRGDYLYKRGEYEQAIQVFERMAEGEAARDLDDFDVRIEVALYYYRFAQALRAVDRMDEAMQRYEDALALNPSHLPSLEAVGPLYMKQERWDQAVKVYRNILQLTGGQGDPTRLAATYSSLGEVELHLGNLDKAKKRFNKALDLRPNDIKALQGVARVLFAREDWNNLLNVYNNIIYHAQETQEVVDAYLTKGFVLDARMNLPDKAAQHYEKSLVFEANQPATVLRLAELALRRQDWPGAAAHADKGLQLPDIEPAVQAGLEVVRAVAAGAVGDQDASGQALERARVADPDLLEEIGADSTAPQTLMEGLKRRLQDRL